MPAPVEQGQMLAGKYRVERVLGEGGMGVVVAATDVQLERKVAIKFLLAEYVNHAEAGTRFMREARAAVKIQSEHIARVIDVSTLQNGSPYMVMEFLEGGDLSQILEKRGPLPVDEAVAYVLEACDAIAEAHSYGIIHRDLKPANLFLARQPDGSSKVKVLDFGISKTTLTGQDGVDKSLTRTSSMMGSPLYMSPEQMRSTKDVDSRTDIWALGVILHELLEGKVPFDAHSIPELSAKILLDEPDPLTRAEVPAALKTAIKRALSKRLPERYPSVAEFAAALAPFAAKRSRTNVERISRILIQAGLSTGDYALPTSLAPGADDPMAATRLDSSPAVTQARTHSATVSQWGKTNGALTTEGRSAGANKLLLSVAAGVALLGLGTIGAFFVLKGGPQSVEPAALGQVPPALSAAPLAEPERAAAQLPQAEQLPQVQAPAAAQLPAAVPVAEEPKPSARTAQPIDKAQPIDTAPAVTPKTPAPETAPVARAPKSVKSSPAAPTPKAAPKAPAPKTSEPPPSFKDKFGSRK